MNRIAKISVSLVIAIPLLQSVGSAQNVSDVAKVIVPFVEKHCVNCHGEKKQAGKLALHQLDGSLASEQAREVWARVAEKLWLGEMPPEDEPRPSPHASGRVVNWLSAPLALRNGCRWSCS